MKTKEIQQIIASHYILGSHHPIVIQNCLWNSWKEADVLAIKDRSNFVVEIEVKVSKKDYWQEFKRKHIKHFMLSTCTGKENSYNLPNYYYFAMPEELSFRCDIPKYAGLIIIKNNAVKTIKKAPLLHRRPIELPPLYKILRTFSEREALGCAKLTYKNKQKEQGNE